MTTSSVVDVLMLHNQTCPHCSVGEPCLVSERIQDEWLRHEATKPKETYWATEDAA